MIPVITDPLATVVRLRIEELQREAAERSRAGAARSARPRAPRPSVPSWPQGVVAALRDSVTRTLPRATRTGRAQRSGRPCPTC